MLMGLSTVWVGAVVLPPAAGATPFESSAASRFMTLPSSHGPMSWSGDGGGWGQKSHRKAPNISPLPDCTLDALEGLHDVTLETTAVF